MQLTCKCQEMKADAGALIRSHVCFSLHEEGSAQLLLLPVWQSRCRLSSRLVSVSPVMLVVCFAAFTLRAWYRAPPSLRLLKTLWLQPFQQEKLKSEMVKVLPIALKIALEPFQL